MFRDLTLWVVVLAGIAGTMRPCDAATLSIGDISVPTAPAADIFLENLSYDYDATSDLFTVTGTTLTLRTGGSTDTNGIQQGFDQDQLFDFTLGAGQRGVFSLTAEIDDTGDLVSPAGTFSIGGGVPPSPLFAQSGLNWASAGPLLTGELTDIAFDPTGTITNIAFLYEVTGGAAAVDQFSNGSSGFGSVGTTGGVINLIDVQSFDGSWDSDFSLAANIGNKADVAAVPVPGTGALLGSLVVFGMSNMGRRRREGLVG